MWYHIYVVNWKNFFKLILAILIPQAAGLVGSLFTAPAIPGWYATLSKPLLNPPSWVFGPVWTILYTLMGISAFLVWKRGWNSSKIKKALKIFFLQLLLNALWSILFFGLQSPGWAFLDIVLLWIAIIWTMVSFRKISRPAFWLLLPHLLWVSFAAYLNYAIWILN